MMRNIISVFLVCLTFLIPLFFNCGSSTEVSDEAKIVGQLYKSDGAEVARDVNVILRPNDYLSPSYKDSNDKQAVKAAPCSTFTNANGEYVFEVGSSFEAGTYIVEAADKKGNCAIVDSIDVNSSFVESKSELELPVETLKPGSTISGKIRNRNADGEIVVCIFGLDRSVKVNEDGTFVFENVPEGKLRLYVEDISSKEPYSDTLGVNTVSDKTVSVETSVSDIEKFVLQIDTVGKGSVAGADSVEKGAIHTVLATADDGWEFYRWRVVSGTAEVADSTASETTVVLNDGDAAIKAVFSAVPDEPQNVQMFFLKIDTAGNGTVSSEDSLEAGVGHQITATPESGWVFTEWKIVHGAAEIAEPAAAATTVILSEGDATIKAVFSAVPDEPENVQKFALKIDTVGSGTVSGADSLEAGVAHTITATPKSGWSFTGWKTVKGVAEIADSTAAATTVTLTDGDAAIKAVFTEIQGEPEEVQMFTLRIDTIGNGTVSGAGSLVAASTNPITATPNAGWSFTGWKTVNGVAKIADSTAAATTVILSDGDAVIRAVFSNVSAEPEDVQMFTLRIDTIGNGTVSGAGSLVAASTNPITATPNTGWSFTGWKTVNGVAKIADSTAAATTVILPDGDAVIRAVFSSVSAEPEDVQMFTLRIDTIGNGTVSGAGSLVAASTNPITATPNAGWSFTGWKTVNGVAKIADSTAAATTVILPDGDAVIRAIFSSVSAEPEDVQMFTLRIDTLGNGTVSGAGSLVVGSTNPITATPDAGWSFTGWKVVKGVAKIADSTAAATTVILSDGDAVIRAVFSTASVLNKNSAAITKSE